MGKGRNKIFFGRLISRAKKEQKQKNERDNFFMNKGFIYFLSMRSFMIYVINKSITTRLHERPIIKFKKQIAKMTFKWDTCMI